MGGKALSTRAMSQGEKQGSRSVPFSRGRRKKVIVFFAEGGAMGSPNA